MASLVVRRECRPGLFPCLPREKKDGKRRRKEKEGRERVPGTVWLSLVGWLVLRALPWVVSLRREA